MKATMEYRGYTALIEYSAEDECLVGRVVGITDGIGFHGDSVAQMKREMKLSVDAYLTACAKTGRKPKTPFSGKILLRVPPTLHSGIVRAAEITGQSANQLIVNAVSAYLVGHNTDEGQPPSAPAAKSRRKSVLTVS